MNRKIILYVFAFVIIINISCQKQFLGEKSNKALIVPSSYQDFQALLDNTEIMNKWTIPELGEVSADNFFLTYDNWKSLTIEYYRRQYIWHVDPFAGANSLTIASWFFPYREIFYANLVIEGVKNYEIDNNEGDYLLAQAYFHRAWAHYQLAQIFCETYNPNTSKDALGIPLKVSSNVSEKTKRPKVEDVYKQIISDLENSIKSFTKLQNFKIDLVKTRANLPAAYLLLSRVYLLMGKYRDALEYANKGIQSEGVTLLDFNTIDPTKAFPFERFNKEVLFHASMIPSNILRQDLMKIDNSLYNIYKDNDIRKHAYFTFRNGYNLFKGSFDGSTELFAGLTSSELYLIKLECLIRLDNSNNEIKELLHYFLRHRFYGEISFDDNIDLLQFILDERKREFPFRAVRWTDIRRLNMEGKYTKTLIRVLDNEVYELLPNDSKYVFPIPDDIIRLSGIEQNIRN